MAGGLLIKTTAGGNFTHGQPFTVTGTGFGAKSPAAPLKYDDFQSVTTGAAITTSSAAGPSWSSQGTIVPIASAALLRSGTPFAKNMRCRFQPTGSGDPSVSNVILTGQTLTRVHLDAWMHNDVTSGANFVDNEQNAKHIRLHTTGAGAPNMGITDGGPGTQTGTHSYGLAGDGRADPSVQFGDWATDDELYDTWFHVRWLLDVGSGGTATDGLARIYYNHNLRNTSNAVNFLNTGISAWQEAYIGNYFRSDDGWTGELRFYWESVYFDTSWARVEIGNHATYSSCTHTEIQIPTAWSDTSVTFTVNRGSFAVSDTVQIFVVSSSNVAQNVGSQVIT